MEHSYEFINSSYRPPANSAYRSRSNTLLNASPLTMQPLNSDIKVYTSNDKNNNKQSSFGSPNKSTKIKRNQQGSISEFDLAKLVKKLDYDYVPPSHTNKTLNKKNNNYEMKLIKMQHMQHNVDLVNFTYINKVKNIKNYKVLFFFIYLLLNTTLN